MKNRPHDCAAPPKPRRAISPALARKHLSRVRRVCLAMPVSTERLSHGEPTFFAGKRVFAMCSTDHHGDGHLAVIIPVEPGLQGLMISEQPERFYFPAYVGSAGWVGVELPRVSDTELERLLQAAWRLVAPKRAVKAWDQARLPPTNSGATASPARPSRSRRL